MNMPALEYMFDYLRYEALAAASVILDATSMLGLVSLDVESTCRSEWGSHRSKKARSVNNKLSFEIMLCLAETDSTRYNE